MKKLLILLTSVISLQAVAQPVNTSKNEITLTKLNKSTGMKDQFMSSTCWSFASNSFLESELIKAGTGDFDLSEMFFARYSYINKIKQHLATKGKSYFTPGGQFHDVLKVIREHGIIPEEAYSGKARKETHHDHGELDTLMKYKMQELLSQGKSFLSVSDLESINKILDNYLGPVPQTFVYNNKSYTAKSFATDLLKFNPDDYVEITSYTHHPFYASFILEDKYNWSYDKYFNVPLSDFTRITDAALENGYTICWDGDVTETGFRFDKSSATLAEPVANFVMERQSTYEDKSSGLDHMMHIVGSGKDKKNRKWYFLKNSWGDNNNTGGYMWMEEAYFKIKTMAIIVNKKAIPVNIWKKMGIKILPGLSAVPTGVLVAQPQ
jgi:bleomycin hydrolase